MTVDITIPSPGESITEVTLGPWHKKAGDWVNQDELLVEIESDKVTLEVPAPSDGVLNVMAEEGTELNVGDVIGTVDPDAERPAESGAPVEATSTAPSETAAANEAATEIEAAKTSAARTAPTRGSSRATTMARKIAADRGVDLAAVAGSGPSGRIMKADVLATTPPANPAASSAPTVVAQGDRGLYRQKMSKLRLRIAERLVHAQHTAAMLTTFNECDMSEVIRLRALHKDRFAEKHGVGLGFMSFFVKACVSALTEFPRVNAYIVGDELEFHEYIDISIAVGSDKGLVVPVLRNAERMDFADIEATIKDFAVRARDGKLTIDEMTGGTFTVSNGGIYGSLNSTPILNPPQSAILGMHAIKNRAVEDPEHPGQLALRPMMYLAMSYDHRIVDGAEAVGFLVHVKNCIENPERLLLGV